MKRKSALLARKLGLGVFIIIFAMVAAACGGNGSNTDVNGTTASPAPAATETAPPDDSQPDASTRIIQDAYGETEVPADPQRIVVLNTSTLDNLLAIGVKPVGAPYSISVNANFFEYLAEQAEGIENTGTVDQPNLETIAKLNPDLIIGQIQDHEAIYEELKRIAPVYMTLQASGEWKEAFRGHADAVGKKESAEELIAEYEARIGAFKADMGDKLSVQTVTLIRPRADHIRIHLAGSFSGHVVEEAGLRRPDDHHGRSEHNISITEEQIGEMDSDVILSFGREHEAEFFEQKIKNNPIWGTLNAVKNDQVHMLDWEVWLSGQGIQSANLIIDDLYSIFLP